MLKNYSILLVNVMLRIGRKINGGLGEWAVIDPSRPQVVVILGKRGTGKTYTASVIIEELLLSEHDISVVVIDPVGVYFGLKYPSDHVPEMQDFGVEPLGFEEQVRVLVPGDAVRGFGDRGYDGVLRFKPSSLTFDTWMDALKIPSESPMAGLLDRALEYVKSEYGDFSVKDLVNSLDVHEVSKDFSYSRMSIGALRQRLYTADRMNLFSDEGFSIQDIAQPRTCTIIDTSRSSEFSARLVVSAISHEINEKRKDVVRKLRMGVDLSEEGQIPPIWLVIEEAHNYLGRREKRHVEELTKYIRESRNFGCSLVAISQQPSHLYTTAVSQHDILIIHNLVSGDDIKEALHIVPSEVHISANEIRMLKPGEALFISGVDKTSLKIKVRPRMSRHVAETSIYVAPISEKGVEENMVMPSLAEIQKSIEELKVALKEISGRIEEINMFLNNRINMLEEKMNDLAKGFIGKEEMKKLIMDVVEEGIEDEGKIAFMAKKTFNKICEICNKDMRLRDEVLSILFMRDGVEINVDEILSNKFMIVALERLSDIGIVKKMNGEYSYRKDLKGYVKKVLSNILPIVEDRHVDMFLKLLEKQLYLKFVVPEAPSLNNLEEASQ